MAPTSELAELLQKRRSKGEAVYESQTYRPEHGKAIETPTKEGKAEALGAPKRPNSDAAGPDNSLDALPPWLAAAADYGVLFYDPEGREIEVPSSQVPAFKACLEKFQDFENTWKTTQEEVKAQAKAKVGADAQPDSLLLTTAEAAATTAATAGAAVGNTAGTDPAEDGAEHVPETSPQQEEQEPAQLKREDLKMRVQKHYFNLIRQGYEPNEAAAKALTDAVSGRA